MTAKLSTLVGNKDLGSDYIIKVCTSNSSSLVFQVIECRSALVIIFTVLPNFVFDL